MAAVLGRTEVGMRRTTTKIEVDETPKSKLMYYFNCICTVLQMENTPEISRLRNYRNHRNLSEEETDKLLIVCIHASPDELLNKCIFLNESMCHEYLNEFYEISAVSRTFVVSPNVLIGGEKKQVRKIMCFTKSWLEENYIEPMKAFTGRIERIAADLRSGSRVGSGARPRAIPSATSRQTPSRRPPTAAAPSSATPRQTTPAPQAQSTSSSCVIL